MARKRVGGPRVDPDNPRVIHFDADEYKNEPPRTASLTSKVLAAGAMLATIGTLYLNAPDTNNSPPRTESATEITASHGATNAKNRLEGHSVDIMMKKYTGLSDSYNVEDKPNLERQLRRLWQKKRAISSNKSAVDHFVREQVHTYDQESVEKTTISDYLVDLETDFQDLRQNTDWNRFGEIHSLNEHQTDLVEDVLSNVTGNTLGSYVLTELFGAPDHDAAEKNVERLDYLLRHGGEEFLANIPALSDEYMSVGPFQLTSWVVADYGDRKGDANINNSALPDHAQIPGSMKFLEPHQHLPAAYSMFATGLARIVREADTKLPGGRGARRSNATILRYLSPKDLAGLAAANHHHPPKTRVDALEALRQQDVDGFSDYLTAVETYVDRTEHNFEALTDTDRLEPREIEETFKEAFEKDGWTYYEFGGPRDVDRAVQAFEAWDATTQGDKYKGVGNLNVTDSDGVLYDGEGPIFVKAYEK